MLLKTLLIVSCALVVSANSFFSSHRGLSKRRRSGPKLNIRSSGERIRHLGLPSRGRLGQLTGAKRDTSGGGFNLVMNAEKYQEFLNWFVFDTQEDTSGGTVNYVGKDTAMAGKMLWTGQNGGLAFGPDTSAQGQNPRHSVRLVSNQTWSTGVYTWDISHAPAECGTWPALWTTTQNDWPNGEMDVLEGVNGAGPNRGTLHTGVSCNQAGSMTGTLTESQCQGGLGCGVDFSANQNTFGNGLNNAGGAVFALWYRSTGISMWKFDRSSAPAGTKQGDESAVNPSSWPTPDAHWNLGDGGCPASSIHPDQVVVMNIDFCGWAESDPKTCNFGSGGCSNYVASNPSAFKNSYFDVNRFAHWTEK